MIGFGNVTEREFLVLSTVDPEHKGMAGRVAGLLVGRIGQSGFPTAREEPGGGFAVVAGSRFATATRRWPKADRLGS
ncbi:hypothetical protein ACFUTR_35960 [Streptomyces sp. NPDC057367]|uniref:hypothetical protein n=1 Tax=Streptomyces sp. NPDC057367 TaxID=3346108 RepID=UPI00363BEB9E